LGDEALEVLLKGRGTDKIKQAPRAASWFRNQAASSNPDSIRKGFTPFPDFTKSVALVAGMKTEESLMQN
jgi:hypothetical protein